MTTYRFENTTGTSNKFYEIRVDEGALLIEYEYGRIGRAGVEKVNEYYSLTELRRDLRRMIDKRVDHGYHEVGSARALAPARRSPVPRRVSAVIPPEYVFDISDILEAEVL